MRAPHPPAAARPSMRPWRRRRPRSWLPWRRSVARRRRGLGFAAMRRGADPRLFQHRLVLLRAELRQLLEEGHHGPDLLVRMRLPEGGHAGHLDTVLDHPEEAHRRLLGALVREVRRIGVEPHADLRLGDPGRSMADHAHLAEVDEPGPDQLQIAERRRGRQLRGAPIYRAVVDGLEQPRAPVRLRDGGGDVEDPRVGEAGPHPGEEYNQSDQDANRSHVACSFQCQLLILFPPVRPPRRRPISPWCSPAAAPAAPIRPGCCAASAGCCRSCACRSWSASPPAASTPSSSPPPRLRWGRRRAPWRRSGGGSKPPTSSASTRRRWPGTSPAGSPASRPAARRCPPPSAAWSMRAPCRSWSRTPWRPWTASSSASATTSSAGCCTPSR